MVNFNHKRGCQKCTCIGKYSKDFRRMSFPSAASRRTDDSFRRSMDLEHHKTTSVIENLNIDMVNAFPTSDPLHLLHLGIMKRCMLRWVFGEKGFKRKWNKALVSLADRILENCHGQMPKDFHRKVRNLNCLRQWKGVEFRTMLLYLGSVALKNVLDADLYNHFLLLCCAVQI